ncbi:MAG: hypothetical protein HRU19_31675, partial [Pseudobacteriovorax sp.]|nr:hypothetical protein [Pseudobacteriovorax sp.]
IYTHWTERIYALLVKFDIENELTRTLLMVVEGALLMAKIERSKKPIELAEACVLKMLPDKKRAT